MTFNIEFQSYSEFVRVRISISRLKMYVMYLSTVNITINFGVDVHFHI